MPFWHGLYGVMQKGAVSDERQSYYRRLFVLGIVFGMNDILPDSLVGNSSVSFGALCALMFLLVSA